MRKKIFETFTILTCSLPVLIIWITFLQSCSYSSESKKMEGKYIKVEGNGGVFENAYITIEKLDEKTYKVSGYKSNDIIEWQETASVQEQKNVLSWTDKWLPMKITIDNEDAELVAGEGSFGRIKFKKED